MVRARMLVYVSAAALAPEERSPLRPARSQDAFALFAFATRSFPNRSLPTCSLRGAFRSRDVFDSETRSLPGRFFLEARRPDILPQSHVYGAGMG